MSIEDGNSMELEREQQHFNIHLLAVLSDFQDQWQEEVEPQLIDFIAWLEERHG